VILSGPDSGLMIHFLGALCPSTSKSGLVNKHIVKHIVIRDSDGLHGIVTKLSTFDDVPIIINGTLEPKKLPERRLPTGLAVHTPILCQRD
jgi:hypothetical protein